MTDLRKTIEQAIDRQTAEWATKAEPLLAMAQGGLPVEDYDLPDADWQSFQPLNWKYEEQMDFNRREQKKWRHRLKAAGDKPAGAWLEGHAPGSTFRKPPPMGTLAVIKSAIEAAHDRLAAYNITADVSITISLDDWMRLCGDLQEAAGILVDVTRREMKLAGATVRVAD